MSAVRISRPCYDKPHRCPSWAGGGWTYPRQRASFVDALRGAVNREECPEGHIRIRGDEDRYPRSEPLRFGRCTGCGLVTWPYAIKWTSWRTWLYAAERKRDDYLYERQERRFGKDSA